MRVISGRARGHKLLAPEGQKTRPTTDKIKESLFNILAPELLDCEFLDLFCGSGAIGIEALSRGARRAVFVDASRESLAVAEKNLKHTKLLESAALLRMDAVDAICKLGQAKEQYDLIFMDPPYDKNLVHPALAAVLAAGILKKGGSVIVEHRTGEALLPASGLQVVRSKEYKTTTMTFIISED